MILFARARHEGMNEWLAANPVVLGGGAVALGLILAGSGVYSLRSGQAATKHGVVLEGGKAQALAVARLVGGVVCLAFGLYKIAIGLS